jgi:hypothetical protein
MRSLRSLIAFRDSVIYPLIQWVVPSEECFR